MAALLPAARKRRTTHQLLPLRRPSARSESSGGGSRWSNPNNPPSRPTGVWTTELTGRYRKITVHQLAMAWWLFSERLITKRQLRVWFAAHEMAERRRYAAQDPASPEGTKSEARKPLYTLDELKSLVGGRGSDSADADLQADLRRLSVIGLVTVAAHEIHFAASFDQLDPRVTKSVGREAVGGSGRPDAEPAGEGGEKGGFWAMFNALPHPRRSVPVPRRMVRALAAGYSKGVTAVVLATLIRSLFWHKDKDAYRVDGRTKREWIAETFGISLRTVTDARARLIDLGWLVPQETPQWLLNRYGTHDAINPTWAAPPPPVPGSPSDPACSVQHAEPCTQSGHGCDTDVVPTDVQEPSDAPPPTTAAVGGVAGGITHPEQAQESVETHITEPVNTRNRSASPAGERGGGFASPDQNRSLPLPGNLKTRTPAPSGPGPSGVSIRTEDEIQGMPSGTVTTSRAGTHRETPERSAVRRRRTRRGGGGGAERSNATDHGGPVLRDVKPGDLSDTGRLLELYDQALDSGLARPGEAGRLDFVALAERARSRGTRSGALFFWLLKERKTEFITQHDEDAAARRIKEHLHGDLRGPTAWCDEGEAEWGGVPAATPSPAPLSDAEQFVVAVLRVASNKRIQDPLIVARSVRPDMTRDEWDTAKLDFETRQSRRAHGLSVEQGCNDHC